MNLYISDLHFGHTNVIRFDNRPYADRDETDHDLPILDNPKALHYLEGVDKMMHITDGEHKISLCHFPIAEWNGYNRDTWHI